MRDDLTRYKTYDEYRKGIAAEAFTTVPAQPRPILSEEEFDRERWGVGRMADNEKRFEDHLEESQRMNTRIQDNTMAHERVAVLLEQITEKIRDQQKEIRDLTKIVNQTYAKVTNGLSHKVDEIHAMVKEHDDKLLGCVDVDTYKADHPSGIEVQKAGKKRRLEVLTVVIAILAVISTAAGIFL